MATGEVNRVMRHLRRAALLQDVGATTDGQLLEAFLARREEAAFEALVRRHGPMVMGVCRRVLENVHDAQDAFQATFLVLIRKAASFLPRQTLGNWLYGVAYHTALKARAASWKRRAKEKQVKEMPRPETLPEAPRHDWQPVLDRELSRLPDKHREAIVLCDLEGKTRREAAHQLGVPEGTLSGRLTRARRILAKRLARQGVTLGGGALAAALASGAAACVSPLLVISTVQAAKVFAAGQTAASIISVEVAALTDGMLKAMLLTKLKTAMALVVALGLIGFAGALLTHQYAAAQQSQGEKEIKTRPNSPAPAVPAKPARPAAAAKPAPVDEKTIRDLIEKLGDDDFDKRTGAVNQLVAIGVPALELVQKAVKESTDPEIRLNARKVVLAIENSLFGEVRRFDGHEKRLDERDPKTNGGEGSGRWVGRVAVTPDGRIAVSGGTDALRSWDLKTGKPALVFGKTTSPSCSQAYWSVAVSGDGKRVIGGRRDSIALVFDIKTGKLVQKLLGHTGGVWGAALSRDGKRAVTGCWGDQSLRAWDVETGNQLRVFGRGLQVRCLALSADGAYVAAGQFPPEDVGGGPGTLRLWHVETGKEIKVFAGHTRPISSVAFSPNGQLLLSSGFDRTVRLWDIKSGKELKSVKTHMAGTCWVEYAAFTPDGKRVISAGNEGDPRLRIWDVATQKQVLQSNPVPGGFLCVAVLPDSHQCVSTGKDGVVRVWRWKK